MNTGFAACTPLMLGMCERVQLDKELCGFLGVVQHNFALVTVHFTLLQHYGILPPSPLRLRQRPVLWLSVDSWRH